MNWFECSVSYEELGEEKGIKKENKFFWLML